MRLTFLFILVSYSSLFSQAFPEGWLGKYTGTMEIINGESKQRSFAADLLARLGEQNREILQPWSASEAFAPKSANEIIASLLSL
jgi:hypothetical protein